MTDGERSSEELVRETGLTSPQCGESGICAPPSLAGGKIPYCDNDCQVSVSLTSPDKTAGLTCITPVLGVLNAVVAL